MGTPREPNPVKLFVGLLCNDESLFPTVEAALSFHFGPIDWASAILPWTVTDFYEKEMGPGLLRRFISHTLLTRPDQLAEIKGVAQDLELSHRWTQGDRAGRRVNIDPGYLEAGKVVLATTKNASHRIYLGSGIYGEATLIFQDGSFRACLYTYADYRWPETLSFFSTVRSVYLKQLKERV